MIPFFTKHVSRGFLFTICAILVGLLLLPIIVTNGMMYQKTQQTQLDNQQSTSIAVVFGAAIKGNSEPTQILQRRLDAAIKLYEKQYVKTILVSGDNRQSNYNEPQVMYDYLRSKFIPANAIVRDFGGRSTYDTCWRVKNVFAIESAYLVTQTFHLARAYYTCSAIGIKSIPVAASDTLKRTVLWGYLREIPAHWNAIYEITVKKNAEVGADGSEAIQ